MVLKIEAFIQSVKCIVWETNEVKIMKNHVKHCQESSLYSLTIETGTNQSFTCDYLALLD